jgi:hypothetical protein
MIKLVIRKKIKYISKHYMSLYYKFISSKGYNGNKKNLKRKIAWSQCEGSTCTYEWSSFFRFFPLVPIVFPSCSHQALKGFPSSQCVPECVPQDVPNSTWVLIGPKFNSHVYKLKRWNLGKHICFYFAIGGPKRCFYWGHAQCSQKNLMMDQSILLLNKFSIFVRSTLLPWQLPH